MSASRKMVAPFGTRYEFPPMPATEVQEQERARAAARGGNDKRGYVRAMFSQIAPRYDLLNHLLSFNIDRGWRRRAIETLDWSRNPSGVYLDLCAGTLDLSAELAARPGFRGHVIGADFAEPMLRLGRDKLRGDTILPVAADALTLPIAADSCAGATAGFGVRNLGDLDAGLREVVRVLQPGAQFVILEFTTPPNPIVRAGYTAYTNHILPRVAGLISGNGPAYHYLAESVASFPAAPQLAERMRAAGFSNVRWTLLTLGVVAIHVGIK
jgi:demethylmenaquinone methyltransferase/2-methoxy-6-polyprenyl-1,4-benzoquinol methylase